MAHAGVRFLDLISRQRGGLLLDLARGVLLTLSLPYLLAVSARNAYYDLIKRASKRVGRPVISIGNITVGGTGKTPTAAYVTNHLLARDRHVAVVLRGYKGKRIAFDDDRRDRAIKDWRVESDEAMVLKRLCPRASIMIDPDRVGAARRSVGRGAQVIVLDDGFQHRRLARDLDIVLVDALCPFGYGHLLPRGLLREPAGSLKRADLIVLTRSNLIDSSTRTLLTSNLRRISGGKPVVRAVHRFVEFVDVKGRPVPEADPSAMRAVLFAGIANFEGFRRMVDDLGIQIIAAYQYPDHHDYTSSEIESFPDVATNVDANVLLTTEKDAVKLVGRWADKSCRLLALRIDMAFEPEDEATLTEAIDAVVATR